MTLKFNPEAEYVLEDERVLLRPIRSTDLEFLLPFALKEPDTWKYSAVSARGEAGMKQYIEDALSGRASGLQYPFIILDKKTGEYAGSSRFYDIKAAWRTLHIGYTWYGEKFRGSGLNKHCKFLLLGFAFETLGALRVEFRADSGNERSIAAMKSIGCVPEGMLRHDMPLCDGGRRSSVILSILKEEWENGVKARLMKRL